MKGGAAASANGIAQLLLLVWLAISPLPAAAQENDLPAALDLRAEAEQARGSGTPLIVMFSRRDCPYCKLVRRDYLNPLMSSPKHRGRVLVRQINQDSEEPLLDFHGGRTTHAAFALSEKVRLVPTVAFYGPQGRRLAEPIIGVRIADFYQAYLEDAIDQSSLALRTR